MKRKHVAAPTTSRKRARGQRSTVSASLHPHGEIDERRQYKIRGIIDENKTHYRIDWADNKETGEPYEPTWEPKANPNQLALDDWKLQKALRAQQARKGTSKAPAKRPRGRAKKVVLSSPETSPKLTSAPQPRNPTQAPEPVTPAHVDEPEIVESPQAGDAFDTAAERTLLEPAVEISDPPSSYRAERYQKFSSSSQPIISSEDRSASSPCHGARAAIHEPQSVPVNFSDENRVIPDSQPLIQFSSSAPATSESAREPKINRSLTITPQKDVNLTDLSVAESLDQTSPAAQHSNPESPAAAAAAPSTSLASNPLVTSPTVEKARNDTSAALITHQTGDSALENETSQFGRAEDRQTDTTSGEAQRKPFDRLAVVRPYLAAYRQADSTARLFCTLSERATSLPSLNITTARFSSPIASVPSFSLGTIGESAPPRRSTPSSPPSKEMAASAPSVEVKPSPAPALDQERRSPSAVPASEPLPVITQEEMNTSERCETLLPSAQATRNGAPQLSRSRASLSRQQSRADGGPAPCHIVPIALVGHQRDQYPQTLYHKRDLVERFLATSSPDAELVANAEGVIQTMRNILLQPDLENFETFTQFDVTRSQEAQWLVDCSVKFRFLRELLTDVRDQSLHIMVVTKPGPLTNMLETLVNANRLPHRYLRDPPSQLSDHDGLTVTIATTDDRPAQSLPTDLVLLLDPAISAESVKCFVQNAKGTAMVKLVVPYSVEHIVDSVSLSLAPMARLRTILSALLTYRNDAGKLEEPQMAPRAAAEAVATYLTAKDDGREWPLADLEPLANIDSQTESDIEAGTHASAGSKRSFGADGAPDDDMEMSTSKRPRCEQQHLPPVGEPPELPMTINPQEIEITHISDSVTKPTQSTTLSDTEQRLQKMLKEAQDRLEEHIQALSELQYRYEEQREELRDVRNERDNAIATAQRAGVRIIELENNVSALKARRTELEERLAEANAKLLDHTVPERADYERLRLAAEQAKAERDRNEKRLERTKDDLEYLRSLYQASSQSAQSLASDSTQLKSQLAVLLDQRAGEPARLRQMGYDQQSEYLRKENKNLKAVLRDREAAMKFRDEEIARLKEASRGRMNTRGTSVSRPPRLGSPMKVDGRGRSRQGSPMPGELKGKSVHLHPLRNG